MNAVVIDTNIYSLAMKDDEYATEVLRKAESILICSIVIGELLSGFMFGSKAEQNMKLFNEFLDSPRVKVVDVTEKNRDSLQSDLLRLEKIRYTDSN